MLYVYIYINRLLNITIQLDMALELRYYLLFCFVYKLTIILLNYEAIGDEKEDTSKKRIYQELLNKINQTACQYQLLMVEVMIMMIVIVG